MDDRTIFITRFDKERLDELIDVAETFGEHSRADLESLRKELARARVVAPEDVPGDIVTMNSTVSLRNLETAAERQVTVVFPKDADLAAGRISVLAPIGTAILGYREGAVVEWPVPVGSVRFALEKVVYQPERSGDFDR